MAFPKKGLAAVLGAPKDEPKKAEAKTEASPPKDLSEEAEAAQDVLDAIKAGDADLLSMALRNHYELCSSDGGDDEGDDEEMF